MSAERDAAERPKADARRASCWGGVFLNGEAGVAAGGWPGVVLVFEIQFGNRAEKIGNFTGFTTP